MLAQAIRTLESLSVDIILLEKAVPFNADADSPQGVQVAASAHYSQAGYLRCINDLFLLLESNKIEEYVPVPDFGAAEKMVRGKEITQEEADKFMERK